ncbi:MAG: hypothetical protein ACPLXL_00220 [Minisyncoccia bacterium]
MTKNLIVYFFNKILFYLKTFLTFYCLDSFTFLLSFYKNFSNEFERINGFLIHFKYFFTPLWNIYSLPAYILSIPIRIVKILFGLLCHLIMMILILITYLFWLFLPWSLFFWNIFKNKL